MGFEATDATNSVYSVGQSADALRGIASLPAITRGSSIAVNVNNQFSVDASNNTFVVSVNDVKGTLTLPISSSYTLDSFIDALQKQINQLQSATGSSVSGVTVAYDSTTNGLVFTTGTKGTDSFIKVSGSATWGLANIEAGRGTTTTWIKPTQSADNVNGVAVQKYIDEFGNETASADGFTSLPEWSPIYLDKGELMTLTGNRPLHHLTTKHLGVDSDSELLCPGCGSLMDDEHPGGVEIDVCLKCNGVWLDKKELDILKEIDPSSMKALSPEKLAEIYDANQSVSSGGLFSWLFGR